MDTLIIQVNLNNHQKPNQLGIQVLPPDSRTSQQRQQQANIHKYDHDYQNLDLPNGQSNHIETKSQINNKTNPEKNTRTQVHKTISNPPSTVKHSYSNGNHKNTDLGGLLITKIFEGSVIDQIGKFRLGDIIIEANGANFLNRSFQDSQNILKSYVENSSHSPLFLTVLRKASSSSLIPSTTEAQSTVIQRHSNQSQDLSSPSSSTNTKKSPNSLSTPSPQLSSNTRHFIGALNTRKIGKICNIKLTKSNDGGFGIKIAERDNMFGSNRPIYITAITTNGSAYRDGRLKEGDMLLEVNGVDLSDKSQPEVTKMLKAVGQNEAVDFVVSRQTDEQSNGSIETLKLENNSKENKNNFCDKNESLIDLDLPIEEDQVFSDMSNHQFEKKIDSIFESPVRNGPGVYNYDIPLNDTKSAGLGLYLKCPVKVNKDLGIWIEKVITGGAAWKDGRLFPDDQILAINGINLLDLSNTEAFETLTAAVSRGIGPEATSNTIKLTIRRRDPSEVTKVLLGTNNKIEHLDIPNNAQSKLQSFSDKTINITNESYQTALDNTVHTRSQSSNDTNNSVKSSNQSDSALSPQTQASNSLRMSNSNGNEKLDNSDTTNDTSSAISQITDFTTVPVTNDITPDLQINMNDRQMSLTLPKTLEVADGVQEVDPASSLQSWDEESINANNCEDHFQRDGFGRQSISEKRHAQLMANNTDTFKKNQRLRDDRDRQRHLSDQMEKLRLGDEGRYNLNTNAQQDYRLANSVRIIDKGVQYPRNNFQLFDNIPVNNHLMMNTHREVPVDVQLPVEPGIEIEPLDKVMGNGGQDLRDNNFNNCYRLSNNHLSDYPIRQSGNGIQANCCMKCGSLSPCNCLMNSYIQPNVYSMNASYDNQAMKRSNSLESIQPHQPHKMSTVVPRAGTVRVARNRKVNESFRAAVDRSYEGSMNDSSRSDFTGNERRSEVSARLANSVANSTTSTSNDERHLINNTNRTNNVSANTTVHKKSTSLLTKFLKLGSMKKNKKNKDAQINSTKSVESKSSNHMYHHQQKIPLDIQKHQVPVEYHNNNSLRVQSAPRVNHTIQNHNLNGMPNGCHPNHPAVPASHWRSAPIQAPNGLWVANATIPPEILISQQQQQQHNMYGTHGGHTMLSQPIHNPRHSEFRIGQQQGVYGNHGGHNSMSGMMPPAIHNQRHPEIRIAQPQNVYGTHGSHFMAPSMHTQRQPPVPITQSIPFNQQISGLASNGVINRPLHGQAPSMTQQHLYNHQPQHIYYYDL